MKKYVFCVVMVSACHHSNGGVHNKDGGVGHVSMGNPTVTPVIDPFVPNPDMAGFFCSEEGCVPEDMSSGGPFDGGSGIVDAALNTLADLAVGGFSDLSTNSSPDMSTSSSPDMSSLDLGDQDAGDHDKGKGDDHKDHDGDAPGGKYGESPEHRQDTHTHDGKGHGEDKHGH